MTEKLNARDEQIAVYKTSETESTATITTLRSELHTTKERVKELIELKSMSESQLSNTKSSNSEYQNQINKINGEKVTIVIFTSSNYLFV